MCVQQPNPAITSLDTWFKQIPSMPCKISEIQVCPHTHTHCAHASKQSNATSGHVYYQVLYIELAPKNPHGAGLLIVHAAGLTDEGAIILAF